MTHDGKQEGAHKVHGQPAEGGLTIGDALRRYTDPDVLRRYRRVVLRVTMKRKYDLDPRLVRTAFPDSIRQEIEAQERDRERFATDIIRAFTRNKLLTGELVATAIEYPLRLNSSRIVVPARVWEHLVPDLEDSSASGMGLELKEIRVFSADEVPSMAATPAAIALSSSADRHIRRQGRPTMAPEIIEELRRRAMAGEIHPKIAVEARSLAGFAVEHAKQIGWAHEVPKADRIENIIRTLYRQLLKESLARKPLKQSLF